MNDFVTKSSMLVIPDKLRKDMALRKNQRITYYKTYYKHKGRMIQRAPWMQCAIVMFNKRKVK